MKMDVQDAPVQLQQASRPADARNSAPMSSAGSVLIPGHVCSEKKVKERDRANGAFYVNGAREEATLQAWRVLGTEGKSDGRVPRRPERGASTRAWRARRRPPAEAHRATAVTMP
jgi:hypothetical protein